MIFFVSVIESIFITVVRLSFYFSSKETHLLLIILGALIYGPLTKLTQFAGFIVLVVQQFKRQLKDNLVELDARDSTLDKTG